MKDYYTLQPDEVYLLGQHFSRGRSGHKIKFITRHHLMFIGNVRQVVDNIWNDRKASAHLVIDPYGSTGQAVWDRNASWANADWLANQQTIAIEHSNNTGKYAGNDYHEKSWNISDETLKEGARVAASYCLHEKLGTPRYGTNIRDHNEFTATGCPVHLQGPRNGNAWGGKAGKYHFGWMEESVWFYGQLDKKLVHPDGTPIKMNFPAPKKETPVANFDTHTTAMDGTKHTYGQLVRYTDGRVYEMESETLPRIEKKLDQILAKLDGGES